jgi:hypothetical protein
MRVSIKENSWGTSGIYNVFSVIPIPVMAVMMELLTINK